jgi:glutathione S-transferase
MLILYHYPTAVCAAKVRMVFAEKRIEWESRMVDLSKGEHRTPDYLLLNPNGVVPTIIADGKIVIESTVICEYLDEAFAEYPLRPADAYGRARLHLWTRREDGIHDAINTLTAAMVFCPLQRMRSIDAQSAWAAQIADLSKRQKWLEIMRDGVEANAIRLALVRLQAMMRDMETALGEHAWLNGDAFTLADSGLISFFARLDVLLLGFVFDGFPRVADWYARVIARPSFDDAIGRYAEDPMQKTMANLATQTRPEMQIAWRATVIG